MTNPAALPILGDRITIRYRHLPLRIPVRRQIESKPFANLGHSAMMDFLDNRFHRLLDAFHRAAREKARDPGRLAEIAGAVENVVDGTDTRIRLVPGYRKKLQSVVLDSLEYTDELVNHIPAAIEVSSRTFTSDPYVNAFFTNVPDLQSVFSHSSEIREYMDGVYGDDAQCCALLCMRRSERTVLGMELSGDMLKRDVRQVAVSFSDHRVYSPAPGEAETREGLKRCLFQGLVNNALDRIMKLRLASHELQSRHQLLHTRLRHYTQKSRRAKDGESAARLAGEIEATRRELEQIEQQMVNTPALLTPQLSLEQVTGVLGRPEEFVRTRSVRLKLNKMGIRISDDSPQPCNDLNLTEAIVGNEPPRVITLAIFPRKELIPLTTFRL